MDSSRLIISLLLAVLMGAVDSTIVLLALPTITDKLNTQLSSSIWIILIYLLVIAVGTTQLGRLGDIVARKKIFIAGIAIFTVGSALCGASADIAELISFRVIQGAGTAMIQSNSGAIIADNFVPDKRGRIFGYTSVGYNAGAMLGIVLGGIITTFIGWRYIFYINVPIGIFAVYYGAKYINRSTPVRNKLDISGMAVLGSSLISISYAAVYISSYGMNTLDILLLGTGSILIIVFVYIERIVKKPLLPLKIFKIRVLSYSLLASFFQSLGFLAVVFIIIMYLQGIRGLTPFDSALLLFPGYLIGSMLGPYFGKLSDRIGARIPATVGLLMMAGAILVYTTLTVNSSLYIILLASAITGTGSSMFYPANNSAVMANSPKELYGATSGFLRALANIGMLGGFVISISIASLSVPRSVAFEVFAGVGKLLGGVSASFMVGIHYSLYVSMAIIMIGAFLSFSRGNDERKTVETTVKN